jgi:hypothetical protein
MRKILPLVSLLLLLAILSVGCSGSAATTEPSKTNEQLAEEAVFTAFDSAELKCSNANAETPGVISMQLMSQTGLRVIEFMIPQANQMTGISRYFWVETRPNIWVEVFVANWGSGAVPTAQIVQDITDKDPKTFALMLGAPYVTEEGTIFATYARVTSDGHIEFNCEK